MKSNFDCRDDHSDIQQNSSCKAWSVQKRKMHVELRDCICSYFYLVNRLLNVSPERKTDIFPSSYGVLGRMWNSSVSVPDHCVDYRSESKSRWYATAFLLRMFTNDKRRNLWQTKLTMSFSGRQAFRTPAFNDRGPLQTGNVSDMYTSTLS